MKAHVSLCKCVDLPEPLYAYDNRYTAISTSDVYEIIFICISDYQGSFYSIISKEIIFLLEMIE